MLFLLALKWKLYEKGFSNVKTKTSSSFAVKVTERTDHLFLLSIWESLCSDICTIKELKELNYCVNIWKTSEAANFIFHWFFVLNSVTSTWVSLRQKEDQYILKIYNIFCQAIYSTLPAKSHYQNDNDFYHGF